MAARLLTPISHLPPSNSRSASRACAIAALVAPSGHSRASVCKARKRSTSRRRSARCAAGTTMPRPRSRSLYGAIWTGARERLRYRTALRRRDQDLAAQDAELRAAGCAKVFKEKVSGVKTDRPELVKAIGRLEPGDVLVVTRLDRLARSTRDLLNVIAA